MTISGKESLYTGFLLSHGGLKLKKIILESEPGVNVNLLPKIFPKMFVQGRGFFGPELDTRDDLI